MSHFDAFSGHKEVVIDSLLHENHILSGKVPNGCTINRLCKAFLRQKFSSWYAAKVAKQDKRWYCSRRDEGGHKDASGRRAVFTVATGYCDNLQSHSEIYINEFRKAGIIPALEGAPLETDNDRFLSIKTYNYIYY